VVFGIEHEMAVHLTDVVTRRTQLAAGGHPGRPALLRCAELMASRLEWTTARTESEVDRTDSALRGIVPAYSS
jgi:glycerol-3-phosphate dehydrogenase